MPNLSTRSAAMQTHTCHSVYRAPHRMPQQDVPFLEENFPAYSEKTECVDGKPMWGEVKLGRIPEFIYEDAANDNANDGGVRNFYIDEVLHSITGISNAHSAEPDSCQAYKGKFDRCFQYLQSRCQHHIHKLVNGKRIIPNACRSKTRANECKHGAPWTKQMSPTWMTEPVLICKGLAKN